MVSIRDSKGRLAGRTPRPTTVDAIAALETRMRPARKAALNVSGWLEAGPVMRRSRLDGVRAIRRGVRGRASAQSLDRHRPRENRAKLYAEGDAYASID